MCTPGSTSPNRRHSASTPWRVVLGSAALLVLLATGASPALAQVIRGRVVDARTGDPISGVTVRLIRDAQVTVTAEDGQFTFAGIGIVSDSLVLSRLGYVTAEYPVDLAADPLILEMEVDPIVLEGISTALGFPERMALLNERLDERIGEWSGVAKVARAEELRRYDEEWKEDRWEFLHYGSLHVSWQFNRRPESFEDSVWVRGYGAARPEIWIDDQQAWLEALLETPNESLCRVESYVPPERRGWTENLSNISKPGPPPQIRAYTCSFMGRVAVGLEEMCPVLQWGRLFSGPEVGGGTFELDRRGASRPDNGIVPIDLGPGPDLTGLAATVWSGVC